MQRPFLSARSAVRCMADRNDFSSGASACFEPGPWQFSHWLPLRYGVFSGDFQPEVYSNPVVWQVTHSASKATFGFGSWRSDSNACACLVVDHLAKVLGWQLLQASAPIYVAPSAPT